MTRSRAIIEKQSDHLLKFYSCQNLYYLGIAQILIKFNKIYAISVILEKKFGENGTV